MADVHMETAATKEQQQTSSTSSSKDSGVYEINKEPICLLVLGMAGSGKTEFCKKLSQYNYEKYKPYMVNLDPACRETPYHATIGKLIDCAQRYKTKTIKNIFRF